MSKKLRIKVPFGHTESVVDIEEAELWSYDDATGLVVVENQLVRSYDELIALASRKPYQDKEILDAYFVASMTGG